VERAEVVSAALTVVARLVVTKVGAAQAALRAAGLMVAVEKVEVARVAVTVVVMAGTLAKVEEAMWAVEVGLGEREADRAGTMGVAVRAAAVATEVELVEATGAATTAAGARVEAAMDAASKEEAIEVASKVAAMGTAAAQRATAREVELVSQPAGLEGGMGEAQVEAMARDSSA